MFLRLLSLHFCFMITSLTESVSSRLAPRCCRIRRAPLVVRIVSLA